MAHAISLRCKRRIGEQIVNMKEEGLIVHGARGKGINQYGGELVDVDSTKVKLSDLGITPDESSDYQAMAAIPEPEFDDKVTKMVKGEEPITKSKLVQEGRKYQGKKVKEDTKTRNDSRLTIRFSSQEKALLMTLTTLPQSN